MKKHFLLCVFIFLASVLLAETYASKSAYKKIELEDESESSITINCNVSNAEVYINKHYQGRTDITLKSLRPGSYNLEVRKPGYETAFYRITVKKGYNLVYNITLEREKGYLQLLNCPSGALIYLDGSKKTSTNSSYLEVETGTYTLKVRKFGFYDFETDVTIRARKTTTVSVSLTPARFEIYDFELSKNLINPDYSSGIGKTEISFSVTADGTAYIYITDDYNNLVWDVAYNSFSTWNHSVDWDGTDSDGIPLPDGIYKVGIVSGDDSYCFEDYVTLDRSFTYPLVSYTASGGGIGNVPTVFMNNTHFIMPFIFVKPVFGRVNEGSSYYMTQIGGGALFDFARTVEIGISSAGCLSNENSDYLLNTSLKLYHNFPLSEGGAVGIAGLFRFGSSKDAHFPPNGVDNGTGIGTGLVLGYDSGSYYGGVSTEYIWGAANGRQNCKEDVWKNSVCFSYMPVLNARINFWASVNSYNSYYSFDFWHGIDAGLEFSVLPGSSTFMISTKVDGLIVIGYAPYVSAQITLSYLF